VEIPCLTFHLVEVPGAGDPDHFSQDYEVEVRLLEQKVYSFPAPQSATLYNVKDRGRGEEVLVEAVSDLITTVHVLLRHLGSSSHGHGPLP
jgi:hypothetical protein